jgi:hypothetical protein
VSKKQMEEINIRPDSFHGEWNYTIRPKYMSVLIHLFHDGPQGIKANRAEAGVGACGPPNLLPP